MAQQIGGDNVAGHKITTGNIIDSVVNIEARTLTAAEEAGIAHDLERRHLALGVHRLVASLKDQLESSDTGGGPYKDLLPYELNDAELFFGRQQAIQDMLACLERGRLTVLHAESGAGKTSLLQAGIAPRLIAQGHLALSLRPRHENPALVVRQTFLPDPGLAPGLAQAPLSAFLRMVGEILGPGHTLYLFLDQFEEFFRQEKDERSAFGCALAQGLDDPGLDVRWVVALRAEAFSALAELEESGIAPFKNAHRLNRMGRDEARLAIQEPGRCAGLTFQPELVETLLNDLGGKGDISPVQLSLVCSALSAGAAQGQPVTMQSLKEQGGVEGILRGYLQRQIGTLPPEQREPARRVLRALVSADKRRTTKNISLLTGELIRQKISPPVLRDLLSRLVERRLVIAHESDTGVSYELAHDYLLGEIELDPAEQARKAAQELLDQETHAYLLHGGLLSAERLTLIEHHRAELQLTEDAKRLLAASRKAIDDEVAEDKAQRQDKVNQAIKLADARKKLAVVLAAGLVVAVILAIVSLWLSGQSAAHLRRANTANTQSAMNLAKAEDNAATAQAESNNRATQEAIALQQAQVALARQLAAQSQSILLDSGTHTLHSGLLAAETLRRISGLEADQAARRVLSLLGRPVSYMAHDGPVSAVAFSPDGRWVVSGSNDGVIYVWETASGRQVARMEHANNVTDVAFSPDGRWVVSGSEDGTARVWEAESGRMAASVPHDLPVTAVDFSVDGRVVSGSNDGTILVWEAQSGQKVAQMMDDSAVTAVAFSPDGRRVVSGSGLMGSGTARVWEAQSGVEAASMTHHGPVTTVAFSPDGLWVVSGDREGVARVWDPATEVEVARVTHGFGVADVDVVFNEDRRWVVSGSGDGTMIVWEAESGAVVTSMWHGKGVTDVAFSPDGRRVVSGSLDGTARVWEVESGMEVARMAHVLPVTAVDFSPDGRRVVSGGEDSTAWVWEAEGSRDVASMAHAGIVCAVAFSPDGRRVVSGDMDNTALVWEVESGRKVASMAHEGNVCTVAFSPDGRRVVFGSDDGTILERDAGSGAEVARMAHGGMVNAVALSPDGSRVVSGGEDLMARVWDVASGQEVARMPHEGAVTTVAFSPDGRWVVTGDVRWVASSGASDGAVRVWDVASERELARMVHDAGVTDVAFSPDGRWVVSGSYDDTARVWEVASKREMARMAHEGNVYAVAFSPDGRWVVSGSGDNTARVWLWQTEDLLAELCSRLPRNFTQAEWARFLGSEPYRLTCPNLPAPTPEP